MVYLRKDRGTNRSVKNPGSRGGKFYRTKTGRIYYGEQPQEQEHEPLEAINANHMGHGHSVGFKVGTKTYEGQVKDWGERGAVVTMPDSSSLSVPYGHMQHVVPEAEKHTQQAGGKPWQPDEGDFFDVAPEAYEAAQEGFRHSYYKLHDSSSFAGIDGKTSDNGKWLFTATRIPLKEQLARKIGAGLSTATAASAIEEYQQKYGDTEPIVLTNQEANRGAIVARSAKKPGSYQLTYFDSRGFSGDAQFPSQLEAAREAVEVGYTTPNREAFEEMSTTEEFARGNEASRKVQAWNRAQREVEETKKSFAGLTTPKARDKGWIMKVLGSSWE